MTRAAIYARVSSAAQRDRHTIENQLRVLPAFVASQGWTLAGTYVDDGRSARSGKLEARDGFAELLAAAERKVFDVLVVVDVDRLTRTDSLEERALILGPFQRLGIDIVTPSGGRLDMRTMLGELWVTLQALGAAEENRKRAERIKAGKSRAIAEHRKPAGPTPFGLHYDRATGAWSIDEPAAALVREMVRRVAAGEACVRVADDFIARGVRAPGRGKPWTRQTVYRLIHNKYSCGEWIANKHTHAVIPVPRIVTDEEWNAAQAELKKARRRGLDRAKHVYLLSGIAKCTCGAPIIVRSGVKYFNAAHEPREHPAMYLCRARREDRTCKAKSVSVRDVDARLWDALCERLEQPELIAELANVQSERAGDARAWRADIDAHRARLTKLDQVEASFMTKYRHGKVSEGALDLELEGIARERKVLREQLATAEHAADATMSAQERMRGATAIVESLRGALPRATPAQRQALLRELVYEGVELRDGVAHLELRLIRPAKAGPIGVVKTAAYNSRHGAVLRLRMVA